MPLVSEKALSFDGEGDYITVADDVSLHILDAMTIGCWLRLAGVPAADIHVVSKKSGGWNTGTGFEIYYDESHNRWMMITSSANTARSSEITEDTEEHHLVVTIDGTTVKFYFDGEDITVDGDIDALPACTEPLYIGSDKDNARCWDGVIDEVRIYSRALGAEEIAYDYNEGYGRRYPMRLDDLELWMPFFDGEGAAPQDYSGNGNDGVITGATYTDGFPFPRHIWLANKALHFDGVDDYVQNLGCSNLPTGASDPFTLLFWVYLPEAEADGAVFAGFGHSDTDGKARYILRYNGHIYFWGLNADVDSLMAFDVGLWQQIAVVADASNLVIYKNGSAIITAARPSLNDTAQEYSIGKATVPAGWQNYLKGIIDEVRIYSRTLSAEEIAYDWNSGKGRPAPFSKQGLVLRLPMDEGVGSTAFDRSGEGNDGTLTGPAWVEGFPFPHKER